MPATNEPLRLDGTGWVLSSLPRTTLVADPGVTIRFAEGRAYGSDGCNRYSTTYAANGASLSFGPNMAATQMACPPGVTAIADAFGGALADARSARIRDGKLELLGARDAMLATFAPQREGLAGTSWNVTAYNNGRQAVTSVLTGTRLTMEFSADGKVAGSAGCNRFTGSYAFEGRKLAFSGIASTRRMCVQPEGIMEQEQQFLKALETVTDARFEGDRLELRTASDALAAFLERLPRS
jgi:heat shock protein HslJ